MRKLKYKTEFSFEFKYQGDDISVHGSFIPGEEDTRDTPGCADRFIIDSVKFIPDNEPADFDLECLEIYILETKF